MKKRVYLLDNFDSFTEILADYIRQTGLHVEVYRNDVHSAHQFLELAPDALVISPGPGSPQNSGNLMNLLKAAFGKMPILGICLGHQAIGVLGGMELEQHQPVHGQTSEVFFAPHPVFEKISSPQPVMRYHSLVLKGPVPENWEIIAQTAKGEIMGITHRLLPVTGLQFHPESVLTTCGLQLIQNWAKAFVFECSSGLLKTMKDVPQKPKSLNKCYLRQPKINNRLI